MASLWLKALVSLLAAAVLTGCSVRDVTGAWHGSLQLAGADDCRIRLYRTGKFDATCPAPEQWSAVGSYELAGDRLTLRPGIVLRGEETYRDGWPVRTWIVKIRGNVMELGASHDHPEMEWKRLAP